MDLNSDNKSVIHANGARKTSVARIYMKKGSGKIIINEKKAEEYFPKGFVLYKLYQPIEITNNKGNFDIKINVYGGGFNSQVEAIRLAISRALLQANGEFRPTLKSAGFLTRDPRMKERKKYGLKKARRAPQFSKR
jgi:small subunit ribosomal protein S9